MKELLEVLNDGPKIVASNFWSLADNSKIFVSVNAAAFRILLPTGLEDQVSEVNYRPINEAAC
jgi:hypothetical protein